MKKILTPVLAIIAVAAIVLCFVFAGQRGEKAEDVTKKINAAVEEAKKAGDAAVEEAKKAGEEALKAAEETSKATIDELTQKLTDTEATAAANEEAGKAKGAELQATIDELNAQIAEGQKNKEAGQAREAELNTKVEELTKQIADMEATTTEKRAAAQAREAELNTKVEELTKQIADMEATSAEKREAGQAREAALQTQVDELTAKISTLEKDLAFATLPLMDHAAYDAAELDSMVHVETYVQATESWWDNKIKVYAQSKDGAYFIYEMPCSEEDSKKLVPGTKICVKGYKSAWEGEVEITDARFEFMDGDTFIATPFDATALLGTDDLIKHQNELVSFTGLTVVAQDDGAPFAYKNAVDKTDDIYLKVAKDGKEYSFCVEFYLTGKDTETYKAVEALQVGDVIDVEGFLYWYAGVNTHITKVTKTVVEAPAAEATAAPANP
jgi:chemotaxis protein histidine kinase CheA